MTGNLAAFWNDCERTACGKSTMAITRGFETPGRPWAGVIWRRCTECRATTVQYLPWATADTRPVGAALTRMIGYKPGSYEVVETDSYITIQATGGETLRILGVNELILAAHNAFDIYRHGGDLTVAMGELDQARADMCQWIEGRES